MKSLEMTLLASLVLTTACAAGQGTQAGDDPTEAADSNIAAASGLGDYTGPKVQLKGRDGKLIEATLILRVKKGHDKFTVENECSVNTFGFEIHARLADGSISNSADFYGSPDAAGDIKPMGVGTNKCVEIDLFTKGKFDKKAGTFSFGTNRPLFTNDGETATPVPANSVWRRGA